MIAVRRIRHFDPSKGRFVSWLFGIAENQLRNEFRRHRRDANVEYDSAPTIRMATASDHEDDVPETVKHTLAKLPTRYEAVLRAKYEQQLSVAQIAVMWGQTQKSIESLLSRARAQFRAIHKRSIR
jgi:RNA polymerase sigma-70 factor (ECF subfamily)